MELNLSDNALKVLETRYLLKNKEGKIIETPEELFRRVAINIAKAEYLYPAAIVKQLAKKYENDFFELMISGKFLPNSPTLMNAGKKNGMLNGCFVLPVEDSVDSIFSSIKHTALIQKAGGGTGFNFSKLRPEGDIVETSGGKTTGPIPFIKVFSEATTAIQQGALRRGANMGIMSIEHPDIIKFINIKDNLTQLTNFNLSIGITDKFIENYLKYPNSDCHVQNPRTKQWKSLKKEDSGWYSYKDIFDLIIEKAWKTGEPGLVFLDRINENNPTPNMGKITGTNPCGEAPLLDYEACTLGSINVSKFHMPDFVDKMQQINWQELRQTIKLAVRFLDNTIDVNYYPLPEIEAICKGNRKIGLGIMGFADLLFKLNIPYNSKEAREFADVLGLFLKTESHKASNELSIEKGTFPNWKGSIWDKEKNSYYPMRNASVTTIAPTGSISIIARCSGGIEPLFSLVYERNILDGEKMIEVNSIFEEELEFFLKHKIKHPQFNDLNKEEMLKEIHKEGTLKDTFLSSEIKKVFVCSHDIKAIDHLKMQEVFQKHIDSGISKTINFTHDTSIEDIKYIFIKSLQSNIKGLTVYRNGCRAEQPMNLKNKEEEHKNKCQSGLIFGYNYEIHNKEDTCLSCENKLYMKCRNENIKLKKNKKSEEIENILKNHTEKTNKILNKKERKIRNFEFNDTDIFKDFENNEYYIKCSGCDAQIIASKSISFNCNNCNYNFIYNKNKKEDYKKLYEDLIKEKITELPLELKPEKLPDILPCIKIKQVTPFGNMHVKICYDPGTNKEKEIFAQLGKGGDIATSDLEAICRLISLYLRSNGTIQQVEKQLVGIGSTLTIPTKEGSITSLADGLAKAIQKYLIWKKNKPNTWTFKSYKNTENFKSIDEVIEIEKKIENKNNNIYKQRCPDCSGLLNVSEGCVNCLGCGYTLCG